MKSNLNKTIIKNDLISDIKDLCLLLEHYRKNVKVLLNYTNISFLSFYYEDVKTCTFILEYLNLSQLKRIKKGLENLEKSYGVNYETFLYNGCAIKYDNIILMISNEGVKND